MRIRRKTKSIKTKLLESFSITIIIIILFLIFVNSMILETFYIYSKTKTINNIYEIINKYYNNEEYIDLEEELKVASLENNFDILIRTNQDLSVFSVGRDSLLTMEEMINMSNQNINKKDIIQEKDNLLIQKIESNRKGENYVFLTAKLDNGYWLYIRIAISPIQESVKISNKFLIVIGGIAIIIAGIIATIIARKFTNPILELKDIAEKMSHLDFSKKYKEKQEDDELNILGNSINRMSDTLKISIEELKNTNIELEKDIEEKSKIDEMRKQFISDVSHELKTPISLIQGYAEGLIENVNKDEESKDFYAKVILDESNKMDKMVKQLLELMQLEYGKREMKKDVFDIVELIKETIRRYNVVIKEENIEVNFENNRETLVYAEQFSIEQIVTNYFTNAVKNVELRNGKKTISINLRENNDKVRVTIFNTGASIEKEEMERIWKRFYKIDEARTRENGGSGIGLSIVRALMNNYGNEYGVQNVEDGVEFYFDIDIISEEEK